MMKIVTTIYDNARSISKSYIVDLRALYCNTVEKAVMDGLTSNTVELLRELRRLQWDKLNDADR